MTRENVVQVLHWSNLALVLIAIGLAFTLNITSAWALLIVSLVMALFVRALERCWFDDGSE